MDTIGFIGLGQMGEPIARGLRASGLNLRVYNRTQSKAERLAAAGDPHLDFFVVHRMPSAAERSSVSCSQLTSSRFTVSGCSMVER